MVWFLIWFVFASAILGFLWWSTNITLAQKKAWEAFATRYKLTIKRLGFFEPVSIEGMMQDRRFQIYVHGEPTVSRRAQSVYTHIEIDLKNPLPCMMLLASRDVPDVLAGVSLPQPVTGVVWGSAAPAKAEADDAEAARAWFTPARVAAFEALAAHDKQATVLVIAAQVQFFLLYRTPDPLRDPRALQALVQKLYAQAKLLDADAPALPAPAAV